MPHRALDIVLVGFQLYCLNFRVLPTSMSAQTTTSIKIVHRSDLHVGPCEVGKCGDEAKVSHNKVYTSTMHI